MKDFSGWKEYEGTSEGSGRSEKIWLINPNTNQIGLFKFKKDKNTTDHISEYMAYKLAELISLPCAKFELGTFNGREGSISYNIIKDGEQLIEGIYFICHKYPYYDPERFIDKESNAMYSIEMIKESIENFLDFEHFLKIVLFDYIIGNTDRHQSNWAAVSSKKGIEWSPLYDNSSSLCAYVPETKIDGYLGNDMERWNSLVINKSKSLIRTTICDEKRPSHLEMIKYIKENYYDITVDFVKQMIKLVNKRNVIDILQQSEIEGLSTKKKLLILKFILSKVDMMNWVYFGKEDYNVSQEWKRLSLSDLEG